MKINIYGARSIPARWGGFDNTATEIGTRLVERGHEVTAYIMPGYGLPERPSDWMGVRLKYLPTLYGKHLETPIHEVLSGLAGLFRPAHIHYVLGCRTSWFWAAHRLLGRTVVFNTDGLDFLRRKWGPAARRYLRFSYRMAAKIGSGLIHDNTHIRSYFKDHFGVGGAFISIGGHVYDSKQPEILNEYDLEPHGYYLIACRIEPDNNIRELVEGFVASSTRRKLVIAGGANYRSPYVEGLKGKEDPRLIFLGPVYEENHIEELHANCFAYLHGHEVGGTNPSLLKAMGARNLICANGTPYNREVLGEENGVFFEPDPESVRRAIEWLEAEGAEMAEFSDRARDRMESYYTWDYSAQLHDHYFRYLIGELKAFRETF